MIHSFFLLYVLNPLDIWTIWIHELCQLCVPRSQGTPKKGPERRASLLRRCCWPPLIVTPRCPQSPAKSPELLGDGCFWPCFQTVSDSNTKSGIIWEHTLLQMHNCRLLFMWVYILLWNRNNIYIYYKPLEWPRNVSLFACCRNVHHEIRMFLKDISGRSCVVHPWN